MPLLARGGGTSQSGQSIGEALVIDYSKYLRNVVACDPEARTCTVQPGMVLDQLNGEPELLQAVRPGPDATRISVHLSGVAGTFVDLHQFMADAQTEGDFVDAAAREHHRRRAGVLRALNEPYAAAGLE